MTDFDNRLSEAKARFSLATSQALRGDDSAWGRAQIECAIVNRLLAEIKREHTEGKPA
jgi:hypothetical protein